MSTQAIRLDSAGVQSYLERRREIVERFLLQRLPGANGPAERLFEAMRYSVEAGGKRLRPILATAAADFVAGRTGWDEASHRWWLDESSEAESVLLYGAALECIHTYSLIHDDLPCMDDDELRRGRPTCHVAFGEANALLAGDALNTDAFWLISQVHPETRERALLAVGELARAAGSGGMVAGQFADLDATGALGEGAESAQSGDEEASVQRLEYIHRHKTAALFRASIAGAALMAGASPQDLEILTVTGERVGLLFQVVDDILDVTSDTATLGKTAGRDQDLDKLTYPALLGLERARAQSESLVRECLIPLEAEGGRAELLCALVRYVASRTS